MSIDGTPAGWPFDSVEEWALFQYALYPEQGYYLGFEPYDSDRDRESSEEDWEEWSKMQNAEFENEHLDHDRATNDLQQQQQHHDQNDVSSESEAQADAVR
jgi:hypothetical protein